MPAALGLSPVLDTSFADARDIARVVRTVTGPRGLAGLTPPLSARALELAGAALAEVLGAVTDLAGPQDVADAAVELWVEAGMAVTAIRFRGPPMPDWLVRNWDPGGPPAVLASQAACGWGWLVVREAVDSVCQMRSRRGNLLFIEKRL